MNLRRFLLLGNIVLSGLIIWVGVSIATTWVSNGQIEDSTLSVPSKMSVPKDPASLKGKRLEDYALISAKDVFHTAKVTAKRAGKGQDEETKITELNLELKGTVVGFGKVSYAFIMDRGSREEQLYYINDYVMGAQILRIMKEKVILNVDGREQTLLMISLDENETPRGVKPGVEKSSSPKASVPAQRRVIPPRRAGSAGNTPPPD